jgi:F0F1-type ATP synthase membrane subunit b/b'
MEKEIQKQKKLVDDLSAAYDKLSKVIDNAFGSDYVATNEKMIKNLEAQQKAYEKQAEAESKKGKKTDDDKVREYRKAARDTAEQILELREKVAEFFAGQDLTSAAESFASAWREAYAEFGDTADAIKEKMEDMIHNLIEKAAMAGIVQAVLKPWYDELNRLTPEEVDSERIAELIGNAYALIPTLNEGLAIATSNLEAAGVNMRQAAGNFSGISRDYATATEGAINGLAAGVNTQNFYISHVPEIAQNVALILAALNGSLGRPEAPSAGVSEPKYMSFLPEMHSDLHEIRLMLAKVISPNGVASNTHYVATR